MHCGGCMRKVEAALRDVPGVASARANLSARRATVVFDEPQTSAAPLVDALGRVGFKAAELAPEAVETGLDTGRPLLSSPRRGWLRRRQHHAAVGVGLVRSRPPTSTTHELFHWLSAVIALPAVAYAGQPFFSSAWQALKRFRANMDVPISLAILLSTTMSLYQTVRGTDQVYFDASVTLLFFLLIGRYLDARVRVRARGAAENLLGLKAQWAHVIAPDGVIERLPSRLVEPGMRIAVAAGERFPADGVISSGVTSIDESLITGETLPREAAVGRHGLRRRRQSWRGRRDGGARRRGRYAAGPDRAADGDRRAGSRSLCAPRRPRRALLCAGRCIRWRWRLSSAG